MPALSLRIGGFEPDDVVRMVLYGMAVVAAAFLLAWAAEAAQLDVSGGLAIAALALIAVLPEYAVDLYYAYTAGHEPGYVQFAAANMTGSNRLLLGLGWPVVALVALAAARRLGRGSTTALQLDTGNRLELGFLLVAGAAAFAIPLTGEIHLSLSVLLLGWFGFYLYRLTRDGEVEEPDLVGTSAALGALRRSRRQVVIPALFAAAAAVILVCAEPFANSLVGAGNELGINQFLLVQWLAPLSSEAPEFIIAIIFASRGNGAGAIATLISSKVNQWTLLVGSLPIAYLIGGGTALHLDSRQVEEMLLTATQTMMGVALILALRFDRASAWILLALFAVQLPITGTTARLSLSAVYGVIALAAFFRHRRHILPTLVAPLRQATHPD